jgi:hypothetical protein
VSFPCILTVFSGPFFAHGGGLMAEAVSMTVIEAQRLIQ